MQLEWSIVPRGDVAPQASVVYVTMNRKGAIALNAVDIGPSDGKGFAKGTFAGEGKKTRDLRRETGERTTPSAEAAATPPTSTPSGDAPTGTPDS